MQRLQALYPLQWTRPREWDWVDRLCVAMIAACSALGLGGGVAIAQTSAPSIWLDVALGVIGVAVGVVAGHGIMALVVYGLDKLFERIDQAAEETGVTPTIWERRLGIGLLSYFLLIFPLASIEGIVLGGAPRFWTSAGALSVYTCNALFSTGLILLFTLWIRHFRGMWRTATGFVMVGLVYLWLFSELYFRLSLLAPNALPPLRAVIPGYGFLADWCIPLALVPLGAALLLDRMLGNLAKAR